MYHHRGAYLQALAMAYHARLAPGSAYLWTLPMFHCNGLAPRSARRYSPHGGQKMGVSAVPRG